VAAISRSPGDPEGHLLLAAVRGATGGDPRPEIARAGALDPRSFLAGFYYALSINRRPQQWPATFRAVMPMIDREIFSPTGAGPICPGIGPGYWRWTTWTERYCVPSHGE
jgi:hypothetical protein